MKADIMSPNPNRQPHTLESDHAKVVPPHCKARKKLAKAAVSKMVPTISILANFSLRERDKANGLCGGGFKNATIRMKATKPIAK
jgi:hypothetical protein